MTTFKKPVLKLKNHVSSRTGLGNYQWVNMKYVSRQTIDPGLLGAAGVYQFRINSIFDPDFTGVGGQPLAHDQFEPLFESYIVSSCRYRVVFSNTGVNGYCIGVYVSDQQTVSNITENMIENGSAEWDLIAQNTSGPSIKEFNGYVDLAKLQGRTFKNYLDDERGGANFGSNPADPVFLTVFASDSDQGDPAAIRTWVELDMRVLLRGNKYTPRS